VPGGECRRGFDADGRWRGSGNAGLHGAGASRRRNRRRAKRHFALGVIVVRMLTGELPFVTSNYAEYMKSVWERDFQLPGDSGENGRLNAVLRKSLTWDPADRFPSVATLRAELVPAIRAHRLRRRLVDFGEDAPTEMA
jgi:serine/threonine protein kinase